ncbi:S41 family peptidase [Roseivirga sp.]|uniref:S41 family peptidase n=1 Tax=Roseivirga sp. TaxID=1964215 RepID=UPI003B8CE1FD
MNKVILILIACFCTLSVSAQTNNIDHAKIQEDLNVVLSNLENYYVYKEEKQVDFNCLRDHYTQKAKEVTNRTETVLLFEFLLDEFYDNHLTLRTNTNSSYRLFAPVYAALQNNKPTIVNVWQTQILNLKQEVIGAEITEFNGVSFDKAIEDFPTHCHDKSNPEVREWIINKVLSGRYDQPRVLTLRLKSGEEIALDLDQIELKNNNGNLSSRSVKNIGVIRINDALGNDSLVKEFDQALDELDQTDGLILDLRNTVFGGDTYEARGIMGRFISEPRPYQRHSLIETSNNNPDIKRSWVEYVTPRLTQYKKPVVVLVGRWTGSMGEGLAIGFEGMERGVVMGSEMRRLAGEVFDLGLKHQGFGYKLTTTKLDHVNGTPREKYIPTHYVKQTTIKQDETLEKAIALINKDNK